MSTTEEILTKARELGDLIAAHPATKKMEELTKKLESDTDAQRAMTDYNRQLQTVAEKEQAGQPIEVEDKRKLESLQMAVIKNPLLRDLQVVQMDYLDLLRRVDETMQSRNDVPSGA